MSFGKWCKHISNNNPLNVTYFRTFENITFLKHSFVLMETLIEDVHMYVPA